MRILLTQDLMKVYPLVFIQTFGFWMSTALAITGSDLVNTAELPDGVCAIQFKDYRFQSRKKKQTAPILPQNPCTASFLTDRFLLTARHCLKESEVFFGSREPQKLISNRIDILCLKNKDLGRNREVRKVYTPPSSFRDLSMDVGYKELLIVELDEAFSSNIKPLTISKDPERLGSVVKVFGYGRTDQLEGGIENDLEPFLQFDDPRDQAMYAQSMSGVYKGAVVKNFEVMGISALAAFYKLFGLSDGTATALSRGASEDRSVSAAQFLRLNYDGIIDVNTDNTPIKGGDSGGPVLNERGEIVAVNSFAPIGQDSLKRIAGFSTLLSEDLRSWINELIR